MQQHLLHCIAHEGDQDHVVLPWTCEAASRYGFDRQPVETIEALNDGTSGDTKGTSECRGGAGSLHNAQVQV